MGNVARAVIPDGVTGKVQVNQNFVFDEELGELTSALITKAVVGEVEFDKRIVKHESRRDEFEEVIINEVAHQVEG